MSAQEPMDMMHQVTPLSPDSLVDGPYLGACLPHHRTLKPACPAPVCYTPQAEILRKKRDSILKGVLAQGLHFLDYEQALATPAFGELALSCSTHGAFKMRPINVRRALAEAPAVCPACRLEHRKGVSVESVAAVPEYVDYITLRQQRLSALRARLTTKFGENSLDVGLEPYEGVNVPREFTCKRNSQHNTFTTKPKNLLSLSLTTACPKCRVELFTSSCETSQVQGKGGYLYLLVDTSLGLKYIGITAATPEIRFELHKQAAEKNLTRPLYKSMSERPNDFKVIPLAYYYDLTELSVAEREAIIEHNTKWPHGYNLSDGGELGGRQPKKISQSTRKPALARTRVQVDRESKLGNTELCFTKRCAGLGVSRQRVSVLMREKGLTFDEAVSSLPKIEDESGRNFLKVSDITVMGTHYTEGFNKTCATLGVNNKKVLELVKLKGISRADAIELMLSERQLCASKLTGPPNKLEIKVGDKIFTRGFEAACKELKLNINRVRALMKTHEINHSEALKLALNTVKCRNSPISVL